MTRAEESTDEQLQQQALDWHAAITRADCDWQGFTQWLEISPRHRAAYDEIALLEERIARHAAALRDGQPAAEMRRRPRAWAAAAALAGLALVAAFAYRFVPVWFAETTRSITALAGSAQAVSLADGTQIVLAPGSTLTIAGRHEERLALQGSAWFDVPHDPRRVLTITAGAFQVRDIGTRFEVVSGASLLKVAVAEGEVGVVFPGGAQPAPVHAGQRLLVAGDPPIAEYGDVVAADVAGWRAGRLVFRNEPLSLVALQVGHHAGLAVTVDPSVAQRRFSGVLAIGDGTQPVAQLAQIMGLRAQREGAAVHLVAGDLPPAGR
jgi:transmembrane sensor